MNCFMQRFFEFQLPVLTEIYNLIYMEEIVAELSWFVLK